MQSFTIIPILGRKISVPQNDPSLFQFLNEETALTHDVGGLNFDLGRKRNTCSKAYGYVIFSNSANASATKCLGLYELYDGTNRNHFYFDNGKVYLFDSGFDQDDVNIDGEALTFANDNIDLYSIVKVGAYMVFADRAEHTPYKWKHGDTYLTKAIASGTEFKFRYLMPFQRRLVGLYSDQTNGDIDIRWSTAWPDTAITSLNYPAANQLYIPNDDSIAGGATMGTDRCYIYCQNSINQLVYYPDFDAPFRLYTVVPGQGASNHHSIVSLGDRHFLFNKNYGFCEYRGGEAFPYGGRPISEAIEGDLQGIRYDSYDLIVGKFLPFTREIVWTMPLNSGTTPNTLVFYNIDTGHWRFEDKAMRFLDVWHMYSTFTWTNFATATGGTWQGAGSNTWGYYLSMNQRLVYGNTDGQLYFESGESLNASNLDGYRIEPIMDFGNPKRKDLLLEIWADIGLSGDFNLNFFHRSGDTVGEILNASWDSLGSISCNSADVPAIRNFSKSARLHQIKWGTQNANEKFEISKITLKYQPQSEN